MRSLEEVVKDVVAALAEARVPYVIVGGVAVAGWGNIRTTGDVDVLLNLALEDVPRFLSSLKRRGLDTSAYEVESALRERSHFTIFDKRSEYHVDAKGLYSDADRQTFSRRKRIRVGGVSCHLSSPEDLIAHKLLFGSEQDIRDAEAIYARQKDRLDMAYLRRKCRKLGVSGELKALKDRVDELLKAQKSK